VVGVIATVMVEEKLPASRMLVAPFSAERL
jgi:hypothetical protein